MASLDRREHCKSVGCVCGGFLTTSYRDNPTLPSEECICQHVWWQHAIVTPNQFSHSRGGLGICGGFYPQNDTRPFQPNMICMCTHPWLSHQTFQAPQEPIRALGPGPTTPEDSHHHPEVTRSTAIHPPIDAFNSLTPANPGTTLANRNASIQRMRGRNSHARGIEGRTSLSETTSRGRLASTRRSDVGGTSSGGPSRGRTNRREAAPSHARGSRGRGRTGGGGLGRGLPAVNSDAAQMTNFLAALLPFQMVIDHSDPQYSFGLSDVERVLTALREHSLVCVLSLPNTGEVWRIVNEQIQVHLSQHQIVFKTSPSSFSNGYFETPMFLVHRKRGGRQVVRQPFVQSDFSGNTFTVTTLQHTSNLLSNPEDNAMHPLLFFAPRHGNLEGPLTADGITHPCFPWKVWKALQDISSTSMNQEGQCVQECPRQSLVSSPPQLRTLEHVPPPSPSPPRRVRRRMDVDQDMMSSDNVIAANAAEDATNDHSPVARTNNTLDESSIPRASAVELLFWLDKVYSAARDGLANDDGIEVTGPTVEAVAAALLSLLESHQSSTPFVPPEGVVCERLPLRSFVQEWHRIRIGSGPQVGTGRGPLAAVLRAGVRKLVESAVFNLRGDFYHLDFHPVNFGRDTAAWIAGFWSAVHLITLKLTPDPISPWLLYAAVYGKGGLPNDLNYIRALDPTAAKILEPWFSSQPTDIISDDLLDPIRQLLITYLEIHEFSGFRRPRTYDEHNAVTEILITSVLLGSIDPWERIEMQAFKRGFNLALGDTTLFETFKLDFYPTFSGRTLFAATSNRRLATVTQLLDRIHFTTTDRTDLELHRLLRQSFQLRLTRWLHGKSHPTELKGTLIPQELYDRQHDDPLICAKLLLRAITDADLLPIDEHFTVTIMLNVTVAAEPVSAAELPPPPIAFHTCNTLAIVTIDPWVQNALRERCTLRDGKVTLFDRWIYSQTLLTSYNRV